MPLTPVTKTFWEEKFLMKSNAERLSIWKANGTPPRIISVASAV